MSEMKSDLDAISDPIETFNALLERIWQNLCCTYDAIGDLPDFKSLFGNANGHNPFQAAKQVFTNMLLEIMQNIGRFSPWYTRPARAFGLTSLRDPVDQSKRWMLAPEAVLQWQPLLESLSQAIEKNYSLIQAMLYVENLMVEPSPEEWYLAQCQCAPPRHIRITRSILEKAEIICEACKQPFT